MLFGRNRLESLNHLLDHPLTRAVPPWCTRNGNLIIYLQGFLQVSRDTVFEMRRRIDHLGPRHAQCYTPEQVRTSRYLRDT